MRGQELLWRERLTDFVREQAQPPHKYSHQPRLYALTKEIAAEMPEQSFDDDVVFAAAFLHDLGVFVGHRPEDPEALRTWDHVAYACTHSPGILTDCGFPTEKTAAVLQCIQEHQPLDVPHSPEATLLRDADILEQLGAVGILRTVCKVGSDTRFLTFADAQQSLQRACQTLPQMLRFPAAGRLAEKKVAALRTFLAAVQEEAELHLGMA